MSSVVSRDLSERVKYETPKGKRLQRGDAFITSWNRFRFHIYDPPVLLLLLISTYCLGNMPDLWARADSLQSQTTANNLRIASLSIALYDYIQTLPAEWRFYRSQAKPIRLRAGLVLFVLIRYISITVLIISNVGFFGRHFTQESCQRYFMAAPVLKAMQTMVSQVILGTRTWNISRRSRWIGIGLIVGGLIITALEWFTNLYHRIPVSVNGNCSPANSDPENNLAVWLFYLMSMIFDLATLGFSTLYLIRYRPRSSAMSHLIRVMLYDGIGYFVVLTGSNVLNVILYRGSNESLQAEAVSASLGYAVTWIMSQRILIHIRDAGTKPSPQRELLSEYLQSSRDVNNAMRAQLAATRKGARYDEESAHAEQDLGELTVSVRIEREVVMGYADARSDMELYPAYPTAPKVRWGEPLATD